MLFRMFSRKLIVETSIVLFVVPFAVTFAEPSCIAQSQNQVQQPKNNSASKGKRTRPAPPPVQQLTVGNFHISTSIPKNWPLPIYNSRIVKTGFVNPVKGSVSANAHIETLDSPQTVFDWYKGELQRRNWAISISSDKFKDMAKNPLAKESFFLAAGSGSQTARVTCRPGPKHVGTSLDILWASKDRI